PWGVGSRAEFGEEEANRWRGVRAEARGRTDRYIEGLAVPGRDRRTDEVRAHGLAHRRLGIEDERLLLRDAARQLIESVFAVDHRYAGLERSGAIAVNRYSDPSRRLGQARQQGAELHFLEEFRDLAAVV